MIYRWYIYSQLDYNPFKLGKLLELQTQQLQHQTLMIREVATTHNWPQGEVGIGIRFTWDRPMYLCWDPPTVVDFVEFWTGYFTEVQASLTILNLAALAYMGERIHEGNLLQ